jgi:hypothetical protein
MTNIVPITRVRAHAHVQGVHPTPPNALLPPTGALRDPPQHPRCFTALDGALRDPLLHPQGFVAPQRGQHLTHIHILVLKAHGQSVTTGACNHSASVLHKYLTHQLVCINRKCFSLSLLLCDT